MEKDLRRDNSVILWRNYSSRWEKKTTPKGCFHFQPISYLQCRNDDFFIVVAKGRDILCL